MRIKWLGHSSFLIETEGKKILTDPFDKSVGYPTVFPAVDVVTISHEHYDHNAIDLVKNYKKILRSPLTETIDSINIKGISGFHDKVQGSKRGNITIFKIESEGLSLVHLGDLGTKLSEEQLKELGEVNILLIPVGSVFTVGPEEAWEVIRQVKPNIAIPMHYKTKYLTFDLLDVKEFLKGKEFEEKETLDITKDTLPPPTKVLLLSYSP